jgi:hypothetical protein
MHVNYILSYYPFSPEPAVLLQSFHNIIVEEEWGQHLIDAWLGSIL